MGILISGRFVDPLSPKTVYNKIDIYMSHSHKTGRHQETG